MESQQALAAPSYAENLFVVLEPFSPDTAIFKAVLIVLFSSFFIVTAVSFLRFRIQRKEAEFRRLVDLFDISETEVGFSSRSVSEEYAAADYWLPVGFATLICLAGFFTLFFGADAISINPGRWNMLLTGVFQKASLVEMQALRWQSQLVLAMAFAGAFIFSAQRIIKRLITGDLTPSVYYSVALRMIFASVIALLLSFFLEAFPLGGHKKETLPVISFLTGMTPENALIYLRERISIFARRGASKSHDLPLEMIEGINMFYTLRLAEVEIDNAQNLAEANLIELLLKTPLSPGKLIDWIAQARLYIYFKNDVEKLRGLGIRTVFDYDTACTEGDRLDAISKEAGISKLNLAIVCKEIKNDPVNARLLRFQRILNTDVPESSSPLEDEATGG